MGLISGIRMQWKQFEGEAAETAKDFCRCFRERKIFRWFAAVWILVCYGVRLLQWQVFIDSDIMLHAPEELMYSWYGSRRFGLILSKKLFAFMRLTPQFATLLAMLALWCLAVILDYCIYVWSRKKAKGAAGYVAAAFLLSAPVLAEQFFFLLQVFEIAMAMIYCVIAAFCAEQAVAQRKSSFWYLLSLGFMVWAFGSYPAFPAFYITLILISYILASVLGGADCGFKEGLIHAGHFLLGFGVSWALGKLLCWWKGADSTYVMAMFGWGRKEIAEALSCLFSDARRIYLAEWRVFFHPYFLWAALASSLWLIGKAWKRKKNFCWILLAVVLLFFSPMFITFITATNQPIRGHLTYTLTFAFYAGILYLLVYDTLTEKGGRTAAAKLPRPAKTVLLAAMTVLTASAAWGQAVNLNQLWETAYESYQSDELMAERVYNEICRVADRPDMDNCKVVFVGTRDTKLAGRPQMGDVIGYSYFTFGYTDVVGVTPRLRNLFLVLGMRMGMPDADDYAKAVEACRGRQCWPANDSVFLLDGMVVVKLSDEE